MDLNGSGAPAPPKAASQACHGACSSACLRSGSYLRSAQIRAHDTFIVAFIRSAAFP